MLWAPFIVPDTYLTFGRNTLPPFSILEMEIGKGKDVPVHDVKTLMEV
jgi:hypothetical protein